MGYFYKGEHYSTQSKLGPNEGFGLESEMSFRDFAKQIKNNSEETKNIETIDEDSSENVRYSQYSVEDLLEINKNQEQEISALKKENEELLKEKKDLMECNKNLLFLNNQIKNKLEIFNEKLLDEECAKYCINWDDIPNLDNSEPININVIGGKNGKYTEGVFITSFNGKYGQILKFSINLKRFSQNNRVTPKGYIYFEVKKSQFGNYYATPQRYYRDKKG